MNHGDVHRLLAATEADTDAFLRRVRLEGARELATRLYGNAGSAQVLADMEREVQSSQDGAPSSLVTTD